MMVVLKPERTGKRVGGVCRRAYRFILKLAGISIEWFWIAWTFWVVAENVEGAVWRCMLNYDNVRKWILYCVNIGNECDNI
jgi:hypothetical protein